MRESIDVILAARWGAKRTFQAGSHELIKPRVASTRPLPTGQSRRTLSKRAGSNGTSTYALEATRRTVATAPNVIEHTEARTPSKGTQSPLAQVMPDVTKAGCPTSRTIEPLQEPYHFQRATVHSAIFPSIFGLDVMDPVPSFSHRGNTTDVRSARDEDSRLLAQL